MRILKHFAVLVLLLFAGTLTAEAQMWLYGDVNGDGEVNVSDVNEVINVILGGYHSTDISGSWYSEYFVDEDGQYNVPEPIAVSYDFYSDHTGRYSYRDNDGTMIYLGVRWNLQGQRLYIWYDDGVYEELYCKINENGYLLMSLDAHFNCYTAYRPVSPSSAAGITDDEKDLSQRAHHGRAFINLKEN